MCDLEYSKDLTKLEAYLMERPISANTRCRAYAEWALDEIVDMVMAEMTKPPYYISGEEEIPIPELIEAYIAKMREYRRIADPGSKLMFTIAIKEAESLSTVFM